MKNIIKNISDFIYKLELALLLPLILRLFKPGRFAPEKDVLHVSYLTTKPRFICGELRKIGLKADYMAFTHVFSKSSWLKADEKGADFLVNSFIPLSCFEFFGEVWRFYNIVLSYKAFHCHFLRFPSRAGWELPILKKLGRTIVIHYRGCDLREPEKYKKSDFKYTCCLECDYPESYCINSAKTKALENAKLYGDVFLVTTPDLLDFDPESEYFPFFLPAIDTGSIEPERKTDAAFEIVHSTNHEGIDGTKYLVEAVDKLKSEGFDVGLNILKGVPYRKALAYYKGADLSVGKLMMGYYANFQIESILAGTPVACYIREDLTRYLKGLPIINVNPENLADELRGLLGEDERLNDIAKDQLKYLRNLHDNTILAEDLKTKYGLS